MAKRKQLLRLGGTGRLTRRSVIRRYALRHKRVALLGFGQENQAVLPYLVQEGAEVTVFDQRPASQWNDNARKQVEDSGVPVITGPHYLDDLLDSQLILRIPGLPARLPILTQAKKKGILVMPAIELFMLRTKATVVGVTGTKGKGTTSSLIAHFLNVTGHQAILAGNIGLSAFAQLPSIHRGDIVVLELSSFQLEDMQTSPHIAVMLPVSAEHLTPLSSKNPNFHPTLRSYRAAKESLLRYQKPGDVAIISLDGPSAERYQKITRVKPLLVTGCHRLNSPGVYVEDDKLYLRRAERKLLIADVTDSPLVGAHSWTNISAAAAAAISLDVPLRQIKPALKTYKPLPHRLEPVYQHGGIQFIDDSYGTSPDASIAAVRSFSQPIWLILGGSPKGADFLPLVDVIKRSSVIQTLGIGQEAERIGQAFAKQGRKDRFMNVHTLENAMEYIIKSARSGDVILLSPACASLDQFNSAAERGDHFLALARKLNPRTQKAASNPGPAWRRKLGHFLKGDA